jgi:hypothetical protein
VNRRFVIEDAFHSEFIGEFDSRAEAIAELRRLSKLPWDENPNQAPCTSWRNCGREYQLIEFDTADYPWKEIDRQLAFDVSSEGVKWTGSLQALAGPEAL